MNKVHELLIKNGYSYDKEDKSYEKKVFSDSWHGAFVPFVRLFSMVIFDDFNVFVEYNKSMRYDTETIEKVKSERAILEDIGLEPK